MRIGRDFPNGARGAEKPKPTELAFGDAKLMPVHSAVAEIALSQDLCFKRIKTGARVTLPEAHAIDTGRAPRALGASRAACGRLWSMRSLNLDDLTTRQFVLVLLFSRNNARNMIAGL